MPRPASPVISATASTASRRSSAWADHVERSASERARSHRLLRRERHQRARPTDELRHRQRLGQHERDGVGEQPAVSGTARSLEPLGRGTGIPRPQRHAALTEREREDRLAEPLCRRRTAPRTARRAGRSPAKARSIARAPRRRGCAPRLRRAPRARARRSDRPRPRAPTLARGLEVAERQQRLGRDR